MTKHWTLAAVAALGMAAASAGADEVGAISAELPPIPLQTTTVATSLYALDEDGGGELAEEAAAQEDKSWLHEWDGDAGLGLNGSAGNTETLNFRATLNALRKHGQFETTIRLRYIYESDDGDITDQSFRALAREDYLIEDSKWRYFGEAVYDYDQFESWKHRVQLRAGAGYELIENEKTFLLGRFGLSMLKDLQGPQNEWVPEGLLGADYTHKFTEKQSFEAYVDFFFDLATFGPYRFEARAHYKLLLDEESKLTLVAGVEDEYDSNPGEGNDRNDLDYYLMLSWIF